MRSGSAGRGDTSALPCARLVHNTYACVCHAVYDRTAEVKGTFVGGCNDGPEPWMGLLPMLESGKLREMIGE